MLTRRRTRLENLGQHNTNVHVTRLPNIVGAVGWVMLCGLLIITNKVWITRRRFGEHILTSYRTSNIYSHSSWVSPIPHFVPGLKLLLTKSKSGNIPDNVGSWPTCLAGLSTHVELVWYCQMLTTYVCRPSGLPCPFTMVTSRSLNISKQVRFCPSYFLNIPSVTFKCPHERTTAHPEKRTI
jgi:hypothetical protein